MDVLPDPTGCWRVNHHVGGSSGLHVVWAGLDTVHGRGTTGHHPGGHGIGWPTSMSHHSVLHHVHVHSHSTTLGHVRSTLDHIGTTMRHLGHSVTRSSKPLLQLTDAWATLSLRHARLLSHARHHHSILHSLLLLHHHHLLLLLLLCHPHTMIGSSGVLGSTPLKLLLGYRVLRHHFALTLLIVVVIVDHVGL